MSKRNKIKSEVEQTLKAYPETANSDIDLVIKVWTTFYGQYIRTGASGKQGVWLEDMHKFPSFEYIKRYRQSFNQHGKYLPTVWKVAKQRRINEKLWREAMGHTSSTFERL